MIFVSQHAANTNAEKPKPTYHHCKKPEFYKNQCRLSKRQRKEAEATQTNLGNRNSGANKSIPDNDNKNSNRAERKPTAVYIHCETCRKTNHSTERCYFGANAANSSPARNRTPEGQNQAKPRDNKKGPNDSVQAAA